MPEYLAPGVYVEEVSFRSKSIEGVSTTTTAFVGPTRYGPVREEPEVLTSLLDFERIYGDRRKLDFADATSYIDPAATQPAANVHPAPEMDNYLWHAVRAFFENGGARLYVKRVFRPIPVPDDANRKPGEPGYEDTFDPDLDGRASATMSSDLGPPGDPKRVRVKARFPGAAGERRVRLTLQLGQNVLVAGTEGTSVSALQHRDVVVLSDVAYSPPASPPAGHAGESPPAAVPGDLYLAEWYTTDGRGAWRFRDRQGGTRELADLLADPDPRFSDQVRVVTLSVTDIPPDEDAVQVVWSGLPLDPVHQRAGIPDSVFARFAQTPPSRGDALSLPIIVEADDDMTGLDVVQALLEHDRSRFPGGSPPAGESLEDHLIQAGDTTDEQRSIDLALRGGDDGARPTASEYEGGVDPDDNTKTGLVALEDIDDVSILAAPGHTYGYEGDYRAQAATITRLLIGHAERMRYRIAVLDAGDGQSTNQVRALRAGIDSKYAALYYPWVMVLDPLTQREIALPPSGFVCGIYARNDQLRAVYKAPANEVVTLALRFEKSLSKGQQDVLNPEGVNCFRYFAGRGYRLWGARTISSDPEWKYVNLRRYFAYLEHSVDRGTQWAVFEPNGEALWANVRRTIEDFLFNEWQMGALLGDKAEKAYFVKCDRSTMTQNDLDNGRLVCLIGVAALRPAEFVIFRIGQWTADRRV
jgi:phage tail sheath protein FI